MYYDVKVAGYVGGSNKTPRRHAIKHRIELRKDAMADTFGTKLGKKVPDS